MYYQILVVCFFKQMTAYDMRISDWSSDVCSSDLRGAAAVLHAEQRRQRCGHPSRLALGDIHVDETMLQRLETSDRLAELLAHLGIFDRRGGEHRRDSECLGALRFDRKLHRIAERRARLAPLTEPPDRQSHVQRKALSVRFQP